MVPGLPRHRVNQPAKVFVPHFANRFGGEVLLDGDILTPSRCLHGANLGQTEGLVETPCARKNKEGPITMKWRPESWACTVAPGRSGERRKGRILWSGWTG